MPLPVVFVQSPDAGRRREVCFPTAARYVRPASTRIIDLDHRPSTDHRDLLVAFLG